MITKETFVEVSERSYKCVETREIIEVLWLGNANLKGIIKEELCQGQ